MIKIKDGTLIEEFSKNQKIEVKKKKNDQDLISLWEIHHTLKYSHSSSKLNDDENTPISSLFMTTSAKEVPVFSSSSCHQQQQQRNAYINYSKLRMSKAIKEEDNFLMIYLKADGFDLKTREFVNCSMLKERKGKDDDNENNTNRTVVIVDKQNGISSDQLKSLIRKYFFDDF